jgi:two-component system, NtrC family, nitrogen regulation sensor histidine kinase NtrY
LYNESPQRIIDASKFQKQLHSKEKKARETMDKLSHLIHNNSIDSLTKYPFDTNDDISYYVFREGTLVFWSENKLDISDISEPKNADWHFVQLPNAYCVSCDRDFNSTKILALITVKYNYNYQNDWIQNSFASGFDISKKIKIAFGNKTDKNAIFCSHGEYLFTLELPEHKVYNKTIAKIGIIAYALTFFLLFVLLARLPAILNKNEIAVKDFLIWTFTVGGICSLALYFDTPSLLFFNRIFTPFQYASDNFFASIGHLTVITAYFFSSICLLFFFVKPLSFKHKAEQYALLLLYAFYFGLVFYVIRSLCANSTIKILILGFNDLSLLSIWVHFLILIWGIGLVLLFHKSHQWFSQNKKLLLAIAIDLFHASLLFMTWSMYSPVNRVRVAVCFLIICVTFTFIFFVFNFKKRYFQIFWAILIFTLFFENYAYIFSTDVEFEKFKVLEENTSINGNLGNDKMTEALLIELSNRLDHDTVFKNNACDSSTINKATEHLSKKYLHGFLNKYEIKILNSRTNGVLKHKYDGYFNEMGHKVDGTQFYSIDANARTLSYVGEFKTKNADNQEIIIYLELYPRSQYKSYSFPYLLIPSSPDIEKQLHIGIAKYENNKLVYASEGFTFAPTTEWIPDKKEVYFRIIDSDRINYILKHDDSNFLIIAKPIETSSSSFWIYFGYTLLAYLSCCGLIVWIYMAYRSNGSTRFGLTTKFQISFIILLVISFVCIFFVSIDYIEDNYKNHQISNLRTKKSYIQKAIQEQYYWKQDVNDIDEQALTFFLQELSYTFETDIIIYDNSGTLIASSQPLIFDKKLLSNRMSPQAFFNQKGEVNQQEHIGKLNYLTGYTDLVNGDFLQLGYICIPQFYSQEELKAEIEDFVSVIVHIYIVIILLVIFITLLIGRQLSAPLIMLENKLSQMRIGRRNEKIDYTQNDEIGQLVNQYNHTVDELEQSARLLAQSERESAWKMMARQVAHEINNPLTPMKLTIQQLQRTKQMGDERFEDYFVKSTKTLIEQIDNLSKIAGTFSNFAKMPEAKFEKIDLTTKLNSVIELFKHNNERVTISSILPDDETMVYADPEQLIQVFNNLLKNAIQAIPENKEGNIQVSMAKKAQTVEISFQDNGTGIDDDIADKLFVPSFTTKSTGMGLGLAISKNIIEVAGGTITFTTQQGVGTCFVVSLPCANC